MKIVKPIIRGEPSLVRHLSRVQKLFKIWAIVHRLNKGWKICEDSEDKKERTGKSWQKMLILCLRAGFRPVKSLLRAI